MTEEETGKRVLRWKKTKQNHVQGHDQDTDGRGSKSHGNETCRLNPRRSFGFGILCRKKKGRSSQEVVSSRSLK